MTEETIEQKIQRPLWAKVTYLVVVDMLLIPVLIIALLGFDIAGTIPSLKPLPFPPYGQYFFICFMLLLISCALKCHLCLNIRRTLFILPLIASFLVFMLIAVITHKDDPYFHCSKYALVNASECDAYVLPGGDTFMPILPRLMNK